VIWRPLPPMRKPWRGIKSRTLQSLYWNAAALYRRTLVRRTRVIAVTGSFGKSTTCAALNMVLRGKTDPLIGYNAGRHIATHLLTIRPGDRHRVIETGIEIHGQLAAYADLILHDIAVITGIGHEHHRSFKTVEATRDEKSILVRTLPPHGTAVLNGDDPNVRWMAALTPVKKIFYGLGPDNDVRAENIRRDEAGFLVFDLCTSGSTREIRTRFIGRHQLPSLLAAAAVALHENLPSDLVAERLQGCEPHELRLTLEHLEGGITLLRDDFKASLDTIAPALDTLAEFPAKRRVIVMGEVSEPVGSIYQHYREVGAHIARSSDLAVVCGPQSHSYVIGAMKAGHPREKFREADRNLLAAVEILKKELRPGDVVLLKASTNQRFRRIALALRGVPVTCNIERCFFTNTDCAKCPRLCAPPQFQQLEKDDA
jgi:UDP-N-acetylmuramoyl-tripeptide--D-alanyl-D-alanine ligase